MNTLRSHCSFWVWLEVWSGLQDECPSHWVMVSSSLLQKPESESSCESHPTFYCQKPNTWALHTTHAQSQHWAEEPVLHRAFHSHKTKEPWQCQARALHCSAVNRLIAGSSSWVMDQRRKRLFFFSLLRNRNNRGSFPGVQCIRINTVKLGRCLGRWLATCAIKMAFAASESPRCIYKAVHWPRPCQKSVVAVVLCVNKNLLIN